MITLARVGDVIRFTFQDNPLYLNDGIIEVPVNSLSLLIDESNIATFKKAASNDIFLSCSLDELGMSKEQLINWYKDNMVDEGITPEEVEDIVESATVNLFGYAEYDSQNTRINFKHDANGSVISSIDASDFVIDGMIDNVEIVTVEGVKYLKITFNTESGKEPILIPLADIFNPDNYYTKTATDALLADKADTATTYTKTEVDNAISAATSGKADTSAVTEAISAATSGKADSDSVYTKTEVDNAISAATSGKVDTDVFDEKERAVSTALNDLNERKLDASAYTPTDLSNYYTKSETDGEIEEAVSGKADSNTVYTKTEVDSALSGKQDTLVAGTNITISGNVISAEGGGKTVSAGTNISITTGETADTINCTLNLENGTNSQSGGLKLKSYVAGNRVSGRDACAFGGANEANGTNSFVTGYYNTGNTAHAFVSGSRNQTTNSTEALFGLWALSNGSQTDFNGNSGCTLFAVGNGEYYTQTKHNAFEIRQNGDIYIADTNDTSTTNYYEKPMIKLQDALGGGGSTYTAGDGIDITNDVISVTGKVDTSAITTSMTSGSTDSQVPSAKAVYDNFGGLKLVKLTTAQYNALLVKDPMTLYVIADDVVCAPESDAWVTVGSEGVNYNKPVYNLNLSGTAVSEEYATSSELTHSISFSLYFEPYTGQNWDYLVDVEFSNAPGEESYSLEIENAASAQVYRTTDSSEDIDLCQILGGGFYLDGIDLPSITYCTSTECAEYECLQYDEETGECIEEGECISTECTNEVTVYPLQVKQ